MNENTKRRDELHRIYLKKLERVSNWIYTIWKSKSDDDFQTSPEYLEAVEFWKSFSEKDGVEYDGVITYARELHERYDKTEKLLEAKAESVIKYLGGGSALLTLGALASLRTDTREACIVGATAIFSLLPSLCFAVAAISAAINVSMPRAAATLQTVEFAVSMAEYHKTKKKAELDLMLLLHPICETLHYRNLKKAQFVELAQRKYIWAMRCLLIPLATVPICLIVLAIYLYSPSLKTTGSISSASTPTILTTAR